MWHIRFCIFITLYGDLCASVTRCNNVVFQGIIMCGIWNLDALEYVSVQASDGFSQIATLGWLLDRLEVRVGSSRLRFAS
jgi:hypothetical protein